MNVAQGRRRRKRPIAEINVVPYIDVMLVLLVIFMITTPMLTQGVKVELPQAQAEAISEEQREPIIVTVDSKGNYFLNVATKPEEPIDAETLATRVAAELALTKERAEKQRSVLVKGDKQVDYGSVVAAMVLLQKAGAESVGLMTDPPAEIANNNLLNKLAPKIPEQTMQRSSKDEGSKGVF